MSFPSPITGLKLRVSTGTDTYEQPIPSASLGNNSMQIMPNTVVFNAFNTNPAGTIFTPSIVTSYGSDDLGNAVSAVSTPSVVANFVARKITPTLSLANIPNKLTTDSPFSLSVTTNSVGVLSYESSAPSVATVNSSGLVTIVGAGPTTITVNLAASSDGLYAAAGPVSTQLVVKAIPNLSIANIPNKLTTDSQFSLSVTTNSGGVLSYESSAPSVATVNSSGLVTIVGAGTTTITVNLAASANGLYTAAGPVSTQLVVSVPKQVGFSVLTDDSDFSGLDFDSGMTTLFTNQDEATSGITMPNSNFMFNGAAYTTLYARSNGWFSFGTNVAENSFGDNAQQPINTFRYFGRDHLSTGSYKFVSNNTRLLFKLSGNIYTATSQTFTIKVIITQSGEIRTNYTLASTFTSQTVTIGYVGGNSSATSDDTFLTLGGVTFNRSTASNLFSLLNGKSILYTPPNFPTFGSFTLPSDIQVYQNQTITRVLTPPTSNSSGAFTFTSSNTAVATISISDGVSSINVIGRGTTTIAAIQAASGDFASSSVTASLTVTVVLPTFGPFTLPTDIQVYQNQTITRVLTPPTSNSSGAFTFSSSNTAVATISVNNGVSSINVFGGGTTTITATQALSGIYASSSVTASLTVTVVLPTFGPFTLPSHELIYQNQTITKPLTPPTSNSSGVFTFTSSNTDVATISISGGVSSINVIRAGTTIITVTQAASGIYASSSIAVLLNTVTGTSFGTIWRQIGADIDGEAPFDNSGRSVSLSSDGNTLAIGASANDGTTGNTSDNRGHVRVYTRDTTVALGWRQLGGDIDGEAAGDQSGWSVSLSFDGNIVAIGANFNDGNGANSGHVRVYMRDPDKTTAVTDQNSSNFGPVGWRRLGADIDGEAAEDWSGYWVSLSSDGTTLAIGAYFNDGNGSNSGHVRVYKYVQDTNIWVKQGGDIDGEAGGDYSGFSVSLSYDGTTLAIGAVFNDGNGNNSGHVRVYTRDTNKTTAVTDQNSSNFGPVGWRRLGGDIDGEAAGDQSGYSVSLSSNGNIVAIGANVNDGNVTDSGHVRVYTRDANKTTAVTDQNSSNFGPVGWTRLGGDIDGEAATDFSGFSVSLSSDGTTLAIGANLNDGTTGSSSDNRGHVRVYKYNSSKTVAQTNQSLPGFGPAGWDRIGADIDGEALADNSGNSVSLSSDGNTLAIGAPFNNGNVNDSGHVRVYNINSPTFGPFTLPSDIQVYQNQTITRVLTPPTSNISGAFTFTSSNTAVATISVNGGVSSINIIGRGTTTITAIQAASGYYASSVVTASLTVTVVLPTFGPFTLPADIQVYKNQTITRVLTPPPSDSAGAFTFISSNTAVATISVNNGVSSINVIGTGTTTITATQAVSGIYASQSTNAPLTVTVLYPTFGPFTLPSHELVYQNQTITRVLTPPTSDSSGAFTFSSSNTAVATISVNNGVSSINVIGGGTTTITATQALSGIYASSSTAVLLNTVTGLVSSFSVITDNSDFASLDFDSGMTTLFTDVDEFVSPIVMPNSNFMFNGAAYTTLYAGTNGWFSFGTNVAEVNYGDTLQQPINTFRYFGRDHLSTGSYKFVSNNTRLLFKLSGNIFGATTKTFTIKIIITQSGEIRINYTLASTITSDLITIGYVGGNSSSTSDDIFLTLGGVTFNRSTASNFFSLLNGKSILFISGKYIYPAFGSFTLPSDIQVYQNQTITRVLTPPTSNSSGAFTFTSSNTAVATISISGGVSSINVIGTGTTTIAATQAASGDFASSSVTASLTVTVVLPTFGPFTLPADIQVYKNQTITRVLTPPPSDSAGAFTFTSSNTAVATISVNNGVSSINVIGPGTTTIGATQAVSGIYASSFVTASLTITVVLPTFEPFSLPSQLVYQNQTITRVLTPPTSNSSGAFTFTSSNTNVATISVNNGVSSINVIGAGATIITATQATSGDFATLSTSVLLDTVTGTMLRNIWIQLGADIDGEAASDSIGTSVSLSSDGTTLAIGAIFNDGTTGNTSDNRGHVRVYKYNSSKTVAQTNQSLAGFGPAGWDQLGHDIDGEAINDQSGVSVSLSSDGTTLAIGAIFNNGTNGNDSGHVRVYKYNSSKTDAQTNQSLPGFGPAGWDRLGHDIDGEATNDYSGYSVSLSPDGTTLAIGAEYNDGNGNDSGHVRVYKYNSSKTVAQTNQSLAGFGPAGWDRLGADIDGEAAHDYSGRSVSLSSDGTTLAIGAYFNNGTNGSDSGHVRVYKYNPDKTVAQTDQSLEGFGPAGWDRLGHDIDGEAENNYSGISINLSSDGTTLAIGARGNDGNGDNSGHVRVYKYNPSKTVAQLDQSLPGFGPVGWDRLGADIDGEAANDFSGTSVSLSPDGTTLAIGAEYNDENGNDSGHVRVYKYNSSKTFAQTNQSLEGFGPVGWDRLGVDIDGEAATDFSGTSVSLSSDGTTLAIGAYGNNGNGNDSGHVRVYKFIS